MCWLLALTDLFCLKLHFRVMCTTNSNTLLDVKWVVMKELFLRGAADWHTAALSSETMQVPPSSVLVSETLRFSLKTVQARRD